MAAKLTHSSDSIHGLNDKSNLHQSPKKNFEAIFNSMNKGTKVIKDSSLAEEKKKFGDNLKEMGKMSHKGANEDVRKEQTKMGNMNNVQVESEEASEAEMA